MKRYRITVVLIVTTKLITIYNYAATKIIWIHGTNRRYYSIVLYVCLSVCLGEIHFSMLLFRLNVKMSKWAPNKWLSWFDCLLTMQCYKKLVILYKGFIIHISFSLITRTIHQFVLLAMTFLCFSIYRFRHPCYKIFSKTQISFTIV